MAEGEQVEPTHGDGTDHARVQPTGRDDSARMLEYLSDPGCRAILVATGRPRTAAELCEVCDMPTSTVYRKLEALSDAALLEETRRLRDHGNHPVQYRRRVDQIAVTFDGTADVAVRIGEEPAPARD